MAYSVDNAIIMAAMIQVGKWFDYLRENEIYDNTKIILVSDHGLGKKLLGRIRWSDLVLGSPDSKRR